MQIKNLSLVREAWIEEEQSTFREYVHPKTGAAIYHLANHDPDQVFSISFRTLPIGSTGNMHIMEHSVLNGSKKYRTKEPFMDLIKSSLQTFLNAMTFPDKTMYPVASRNDQDFSNLIDVYLDAVFYPNVLSDERIFRQEGWRHEIFDKKDPITIQGVVYNEMKGAMSSPESQVMHQVVAGLMPDTIYALNSGGDPAAIPALSYEEFRDFHHQYYHPSNARVFLYGDVKDAIFEKIVGVFDAFTAADVDTMPEQTKRLQAPVEREVFFSVAEGELTEKKSFLSIGWLVDEARTDLNRYLYHLLYDILIDSESSPIRRRLLEELGATDVFGILEDVRDIGFAIVAKDVASEQKEQFREIVLESLQTLVNNGIQREIWEGSLNTLEYQLREKNGTATKGIIHVMTLLNEENYGVDPLPLLHYEKRLGELREALENGALEAYIKERILDNPHMVLTEHRPDPGRNKRREEKLAEDLAAFKESLSDEALEALIARNEALRERQNAEDTPEEKATIPTLPREALPLEKEKIPRDLRRENDCIALFHDLPTSGIHYLDLVFDVAHIPAEEAPAIALVADLLGRLDTEKYTYQEYEIREAQSTGGITLRPMVVPVDASDAVRKKVLLLTKILAHANHEDLFDLIDQQLFHTKWDDTLRIQEQIKIIHSNFEMGVVPSGHVFAMSRALSHENAGYAYREQITGINYLRYLARLSKGLTAEDLAQLQSVYARMFRANEKIVNVTSHGAEGQAFLEKALDVVRRMPSERVEEASFTFTPAQAKEAFYTSSDVQFNAIAAPFAMEHYDGSLLVLSRILSSGYLYNEIRAKGGAYGQMARISTEGDLTMGSYRDPRLADTYRVYQEAGRAIAETALDDVDLERYIIGAVGLFDQPMTEQQKGQTDLMSYLMERSDEFNDRILKEMKETTKEQIRAAGARLTEAVARASYVTIGNKEKVEAEAKRFDSIERL